MFANPDPTKTKFTGRKQSVVSWAPTVKETPKKIMGSQYLLIKVFRTRIEATNVKKGFTDWTPKNSTDWTVTWKTVYKNYSSSLVVEKIDQVFHHFASTRYCGFYVIVQVNTSRKDSEGKISGSTITRKVYILGVSYYYKNDGIKVFDSFTISGDPKMVPILFNCDKYRKDFQIILLRANNFLFQGYRTQFRVRGLLERIRTIPFPPDHVPKKFWKTIEDDQMILLYWQKYAPEKLNALIINTYRQAPLSRLYTKVQEFYPLGRELGNIGIKNFSCFFISNGYRQLGKLRCFIETEDSHEYNYWTILTLLTMDARVYDRRVVGEVNVKGRSLKMKNFTLEKILGTREYFYMLVKNKVSYPSGGRPKATGESGRLLQGEQGSSPSSGNSGGSRSPSSSGGMNSPDSSSFQSDFLKCPYLVLVYPFGYNNGIYPFTIMTCEDLGVLSLSDSVDIALLSYRSSNYIMHTVNRVRDQVQPSSSSSEASSNNKSRESTGSSSSSTSRGPSQSNQTNSSRILQLSQRASDRTSPSGLIRARVVKEAFLNLGSSSLNSDTGRIAFGLLGPNGKTSNAITFAQIREHIAQEEKKAKNQNQPNNSRNNQRKPLPGFQQKAFWLFVCIFFLLPFIIFVAIVVLCCVCCCLCFKKSSPPRGKVIKDKEIQMGQLNESTVSLGNE